MNDREIHHKVIGCHWTLPTHANKLKDNKFRGSLESSARRARRVVLIAKEVEHDGRVGVLKDSGVEVWQVTGKHWWQLQKHQS